MQTRETKNIKYHLGNVLTVITDEKRMILDGNNYSHYESVVVSVTDYSPFGVSLTGRTFTTTEGYRYGFNGMESDPEHNSGAYDFGARIMDARLGRWMSVDPKLHNMPSYSPYNYVFCNPLIYIDPEGEYPMPVITNQITGYTIAKVYGSGGLTRAIVVPTYKMIVYDVSERGEMVPLSTFNVTRDGWYSNGICTGEDGKNYELLVNRCSEPTSAQGQAEIPIQPVKDGYSGCNGNYLFGNINCEPIDPALDVLCNGKDVVPDVKRESPAIAKQVMIHIGGYYTKPSGELTWGGTYGCYGIVDPSQVSATEEEAQKNISVALQVLKPKEYQVVPTDLKASNDEHNRFIDSMDKAKNLANSRGEKSFQQCKARIWIRGWYEKTREVEK